MNHTEPRRICRGEIYAPMEASRAAWIETRRVDAAAKRALARYVGGGMERLIGGYDDTPGARRDPELMDGIPLGC